MGMCLGLSAVDDETIAKLLRDPPLIWRVLAPDDPEIYATERAEKVSWFSKLFGKPKSAATPKSPEEISPPVAETDLDKAWHGIHYMLTKSAWGGDPPLNFLVLGGTEIGDVDVGYGPARAITSEVVRDIHEQLRGLTEQDLRARFDPSEMTTLDVYPTIWDRDPEEDDTFGYCAEYFQVLQAFIADAAEKKLGLIVHIS